ncbi:MAG: SRPBCC family protein [Thermoanaerobaculia bacterium]
MKVALKVLGLCALVVVAMAIVGAGLAPRHLLTRRVSFAAPPERVWAALLSIRQLPVDRSDLRMIEQGTSSRPPDSIEVVGTPVPIQIETFRPPRELVVKTSEPGVSYGGTWTFVLEPEGNDLTRLTVTEEAEVHSRLLRFVVRVLGQDDVLVDGIFRAVRRKLTETPRGF